MKIDSLKFLKIRTEKHPTTDLNLEYLEHHKAVCALLLSFDEKEALLVHQYRPGKQGKMYEIPAGLIDPGEEEDIAMLRELREETGYDSKDIDILYKSPKPYFISPGYTTEQLHFYITKINKKNAVVHAQDLDDGEDLICKWFKLDEIEKISDDMKTILSINLYKNL